MKYFVPDIYQKSVFAINYNKLWKSGIKCLIFDLDNTLASIKEDLPNKKVKELFVELNEIGFKIIIMSNSGKERVEPFKDHLNVDAACKSFKPLKNKYRKILKTYGLKDIEIAAVGDQLLTDIFGANRMGFTSILVNPLSEEDFKATRINRIIEKKLYRMFAKKGIFEIGKYHD